VRRGRARPRAKETALNRATLFQLLERIAPHAFEWAVLLLPVTLYLLILGMGVNRRRHPVVVRGDRNFAALFLALSGVLLLGPPSWIVHPFRHWSDAAYAVAFGVYVAFVLVIAWVLIRRQRNTLVIYNLDPKHLPDLLQSVLDQSGVPYQVTPGRVALLHGRQVLDIEAAVLWHSATLTWKGGDEGLRQMVEGRLRKALAEVVTVNNPAATILTLWGTLLASFLTAATMLFMWYLEAIKP
jgi:hypothetical protein